jgi:hypothetical protein
LLEICEIGVQLVAKAILEEGRQEVGFFFGKRILHSVDFSQFLLDLPNLLSS